MFKFEITNRHNQAMVDDREAEVVRMLRETADLIEQGRAGSTLLDYNGNTVGSWRFNVDEDEATERDAERRAQLLNRWADLTAQAEAIATPQGDVLDEARAEEFAEGVASVDVEHRYSVLLAGGGPTEWVEVTATSEGEATSMRWTHSMGYVEVTRPVEQGTALWHVIAQVAGVRP